MPRCRSVAQCSSVAQHSPSSENVSDHKVHHKVHPSATQPGEGAATQPGEGTAHTFHRQEKHPGGTVCTMHCFWRGNKPSSSSFNQIEDKLLSPRITADCGPCSHSATIARQQSAWHRRTALPSRMPPSATPTVGHGRWHRQNLPPVSESHAAMDERQETYGQTAAT